MAQKIKSRPQILRVRHETGAYLQDVKKIAELLHSGAPQDELERAVVNGVNRRFYGADVPEDVVDVSPCAVAFCLRLPVWVRDMFLPISLDVRVQGMRTNGQHITDLA